MEIEQKRRGSIMRSKVIKSFFGITKPNSKQQEVLLQQHGSKVNSCKSSDGFMDFPIPSCYANPPSIMNMPSAAKPTSFQDCNGDEDVDMKAARYISYVQESFRLDKGDSEAWKTANEKLLQALDPYFTRETTACNNRY